MRLQIKLYEAKFKSFVNFISVETIQTNPQLFADGLNIPNIQMHLRRLSDISLQSTMSGIIDNVPLQAVSARK